MFFKALFSALIVLCIGYFGYFFHLDGYILSLSIATGCIVYAIYDSRK
mgnify:CR=1 FL=1